MPPTLLPTSDWRPTASLEHLTERARLLRSVRDYFDRAEFIEVQTPCLSSETVVDAYLEPIHVPHTNGRAYYLQTSPEAAMKRLLAAGAKRIYQLGPVFRADETGQYHNLEFTMLEWYRTGDSQETAIEFLLELISSVVPGPPIRIITYRHLFRETLGFDPLEISLDELRSIVSTGEPSLGIDSSWDHDTLLDACMGLLIQPRLSGRVVVCNYPLNQAALARQSDDDPRTAERFELFIEGVELANGYAELSDADILLERTVAINTARHQRGQSALPVPEKLLAAMRSGLPPCGGVALGFDRLAMIVQGAQQISEVIAFPSDRA